MSVPARAQKWCVVFSAALFFFAGPAWAVADFDGDHDVDGSDLALLAAAANPSGDLQDQSRLFGDAYEVVGVACAAGGSVSVDDPQSDLYRAELILDAGCVAACTSFAIKEMEKPAPSAGPDAGPCARFFPADMILGAAAQVFLPYNDADNDGVIDQTSHEETDIAFLAFDAAAQLWHMHEPSGQDTVLNRAMLSTARLGFFTTNVPVVAGTVEVLAGDPIDHLRTAREIHGTLYIEHTNFVYLDALENLEYVSGNLYIGLNSELRNVDGLANLVRVEGHVSIVNNFQLEYIDLPGVVYVGSFSVTGNYNLEEIRAEALMLVGGGFNISENNHLETLSFPLLDTIEAFCIFSGSLMWEQISLPELRFVLGDLKIYGFNNGNSYLQRVSMPKLAQISGDLTIRMMEIAQLHFPLLAMVGGRFDIDEGDWLDLVPDVINGQLEMDNLNLLTGDIFLMTIDIQNTSLVMDAFDLTDRLEDAGVLTCSQKECTSSVCRFRCEPD